MVPCWATRLPVAVCQIRDALGQMEGLICAGGEVCIRNCDGRVSDPLITLLAERVVARRTPADEFASVVRTPGKSQIQTEHPSAIGVQEDQRRPELASAKSRGSWRRATPPVGQRAILDWASSEID